MSSESKDSSDEMLKQARRSAICNVTIAKKESAQYVIRLDKSNGKLVVSANQKAASPTR
jgi:hypothetical protein